jgi:2-C-methyl-D-erythritol 4-phosphate cytidylyltransferase/2-C-methyl-D-erythritol 2,4-cyclodiphosphate synthase
MSAPREARAGKRVVALLVAGGQGARFGGAEPKQFVLLGGRPLVAHAAAVLDAAPEIDEWIAVAPAGLEARTRAVLQAADVAHRLRAVVAGGATRQESVWNGLQAAADAEYVLVHDAARPFVTARLVRDTLAAAWRAGAATVALPVADTLLRVDKSDVGPSAPTGEVVMVVSGARVDRDRLWSVQTPQAFATDVLRAAHERARAVAADAAPAAAAGATDDSGLVLALGRDVALVPGSWWNIKITEPEDLRRAEHVLRLQSEA